MLETTIDLNEDVVGRIEQDLSALEQAIAAIAIEFQSAYTDYLTALGQTVRQQLVLASYRLCTQGYPERFLRLPFQQRQELQQSLRQLAQQAADCLLLPVQPGEAIEPALPDEEDAAPDAEADEEAPTELELETAMDEPDESDELDELDEPDELDEEAEDEVEDAAPDDFSQHLSFDFEPPIDPKQLSFWIAAAERHTLGVLQSVSHAANRLLQQANILPANLPEPVLEVATKAGMMAEAPSETPNLLNLLVEAEDEDEAKVTQIIAIRLRLAEIEFGNAVLSAERSKLRSLTGRLNQLGRSYQKKQRERAIAEAEAAWRSSWFEA